MIDRIASYIYQSRNGAECAPWLRLPWCQQEPYRNDARAALIAMRDPTDAMLEAAWNLTVVVTPEERMLAELGDMREVHKRKMRRRYRAMMKEASR